MRRLQSERTSSERSPLDAGRALLLGARSKFGQW
jgi:hypothetical protein